MESDLIADWVAYTLTEDWISALKTGLKVIHDERYKEERKRYLESLYRLIKDKLNRRDLVPIDFLDLSEEEEMKIIEDAAESILTGKEMPVRDKELRDLEVGWTTFLIQDDYLSALKTGLKILNHYKTRTGKDVWCDNLFKLIKKRFNKGDLFPSNFYNMPVNEKVSLIENVAREIFKEKSKY